MRANGRRKFAMAEAVLAFVQANPSTDRSYQTVVSQLKAGLAKAAALGIQQEEGRAGEHAAVEHRDALRRGIQQQLRHLARVGRRAAKTDPELAAKLVAPDPGGPYLVFLAAAKTQLATAAPHQELLLGLGLGESFVAKLTDAITQFDGTVTTANNGRRDHVGARADLIAVCRDCVEIVGVLDGLNRDRFKGDANTLAAWKSAKNVGEPARQKRKAAAKP